MYSLPTSPKLRELTKFIFLSGLFGLSCLFASFYFAEKLTSPVGFFIVFFLVSIVFILKFVGDYFDVAHGIRMAKLHEELKNIQDGAEAFVHEYTKSTTKTVPKLKFFPSLEHIDDVKALYKKLVKIHHPDAGGKTENFQLLNTEYQQALTFFT